MKRPESEKPRKQRKFLYEAELHLRRKMLAAHLSKELKEQLKKRSVMLRTGDEVKVMRGKFRGKIGKVVRVDYKKYRIYIEGCTVKNAKGEEKLVAIHPSKVMIVRLNLEDKWRKEALGIKS